MRFLKTRTIDATIGCMLAIFLFLPRTTLGGGADSTTNPSASVTSQPLLWPKFYAQTGAYAVQTPQELKAMANLGFHFALLHTAIMHNDAVSRYGITYVDINPQYEIYTLCHPELVKSGTCSESTQENVLSYIKNYVSKNSDNANMIGYWVLDDDPGGDIRPLLRKVHDAIASENARSTFPRPAICAFQSVESLENFDAGACDMVAVYIYSAKTNADNAPIDWALNARLPPLLAALRARGWDQHATSLIGMPQAFGNYEGRNYALPTAADVAAQSEAFCRAGAVALLAYAWHDGFAKKGAELYNTPSLVEGLKQGMQICKAKYWN